MSTQSSPLSHSPYLRVVASLFGTIFAGYGVNGFLRPSAALEVFLLPVPSSAVDQSTAHSLVYLYSIKEFLIASAIYATAWYGDRKSLGWICIASSLAAVGDGLVCKNFPGEGEWNHWGYAPVLTVVGLLLLGVADGKAKGLQSRKDL